MTTLQSWLSDPEKAGEWTLLPQRSAIGFRNRSFWGLVPVKGTFTGVSGDGRLTAEGAVFGRVDIVAASLDTGVGMRDRHLRSADFFHVERFPGISVEITAVKPTAANSAQLRATLTVKGSTKPLPLPVMVDIGDDGTVRISAQTNIDRRHWGVSGNLLGMVAPTTTLFVDAVFAKSA